jgi:hypothetical protein
MIVVPYTCLNVHRPCIPTSCPPTLHINRLFPHVRIPQILLNLPHIPLSKLLLRILRAHTRRHNNILAHIPVDRRRNALLVRQLQAVNHPQHLARIAPRRRRVRHGEPDLLRRVDDEHRADSECDAAVLGEVVEVVLRDHVVQEGDVAVGVGDDGELDGGVGGFVDVADPAVVGGKVVGALGVG